MSLKMSNIKSLNYFEVRPWVPEAINTKEENDLMIKGVINDLKGLEAGANSVLVGGDTLVFGSIDDNGNYNLYECQVRRASANLVLEHPVIPSDGSVN
jgi:hypothetical protein